MRDMLQTFHQFRFHILAFIALVLLHGAIPLHSAESGLPSDVTKAIDKCDDDIIKARRTLIGTLVKAKDKATKSGNLDTANAINAKIAEVNKLTGDDAPLLGTEASGGAHTSKVVMLFPLPDFKGTPVIVKTTGTILTVASVGFPNDALRSIKVPEGMAVTVFDGDDGGGTATIITADTATVTGSASGMTSLMVDRAK